MTQVAETIEMTDMVLRVGTIIDQVAAIILLAEMTIKGTMDMDVNVTVTTTVATTTEVVQETAPALQDMVATTKTSIDEEAIAHTTDLGNVKPRLTFHVDSAQMFPTFRSSFSLMFTRTLSAGWKLPSRPRG